MKIQVRDKILRLSAALTKSKWPKPVCGELLILAERDARSADLLMVERRLEFRSE